MKSKGPPNPRLQGGEYIVGIGGSSIGNAFGAGSNVINIGGDNYGQVGVTLTNCINMILKEPSDGRRALLEALNRDVRRLIENLPADKQDAGPEVAENLEMLVKQATSEKPNRKWYSLSADGLLEASKWVQDFTGRIGGTLLTLGKAIWPDFEMPESN
jgi:internalin A